MANLQNLCVLQTKIKELKQQISALEREIEDLQEKVRVRDKIISDLKEEHARQVSTTKCSSIWTINFPFGTPKNH